jgi:elongation factor Tu
MAADPSFQMTVEDVFTIRGSGTVLTGRIERGVLKVGDEVTLKNRMGSTKIVVNGLESFRKTLLEAKAGDNVGVLVRDIAQKEVQRGDTLTGSESEFTWKP